jgi:hypothetical protein
MRRRRRKRASELTSLIDVLFILLFASLVQARNSMEREEPAVVADAGVPDAGSPDAGPPDAGPPDAGPPDAAPDAAPGPGDGGVLRATNPHRERTRRLSTQVASAVQGADVFVVEVAVAGYATEIGRWRDGALLGRQAVQQRLADVRPGHSSEYPVYVGDDQPWQRLCSLVLAGLSQPQPDLGGAVVFIIVDVPLDDLPLWLRDGLRADAARCRSDTGATAILLDPTNSIPWSELDGIQ